jgi:hypothetical protein
MMASRGMGAMSPKKMPGKKEITRKDDPNKVAMYKKGGKVKKMAAGDLVKDVEVKPTSASSNENYTGFGANISGDIPLSEKEKLALNADISAGKARGQGVRGSIDSLTAEYKRKLDKNTDLGASISRDSSGKNRYGVTYNKRFAEGGKVNEAGNYTKPELRKRIVSQVKAAATHGTGAGQWSARKAQLVAKKYKAAGGKYKG